MPSRPEKFCTLFGISALIYRVTSGKVYFSSGGDGPSKCKKTVTIVFNEQKRILVICEFRKITKIAKITKETY